jgi:hypothetical protein
LTVRRADLLEIGEKFEGEGDGSGSQRNRP